MSTVDAQPAPSHHHHHHDPHHPTAPQLDTTNTHKSGGSSSPVAPAYSPITPKVQPVLPATVHAPFVPAENGGNFTFSPSEPAATLPPLPPQPPQQQQQQPSSSIAPTEYVPQPPNLPFSSEDATDAIALRAAISMLQFQKMKAKDDLKTLESIKQLALDDPKHFKMELAAGRLNESRPKLGDIRAILDEEDDDDEDEDEEVKLGATREDEGTKPQRTDEDTKMDITMKDPSTGKSFPRIPGPQSVVRMPPVNWDKYGVVGEPLESMHARQRRWPGSTSSIGHDKGREHTIAAPFSPFLDNLDPNQRIDGDGIRKDSGAASSTPPGTISEHPMETRSRG